MKFRNIRDLLDWTRAFHEAHALCYEKMSEGHERERVGLLLNYLADHDRVLSEALEHYEKDFTRDLQFWRPPDLDLPQDYDSLCDTLEEVDCNRVLVMAMRFHDLLIDLYQTLADRSTSNDARELFQSIADIENKEKLRIARDAVRLEDI